MSGEENRIQLGDVDPVCILTGAGGRRGARGREKPGRLPCGLVHKRVPRVAGTRSWKKQARRWEGTQPNLTGGVCQNEGEGAAFQRPVSGKPLTFCVSPWSCLS